MAVDATVAVVNESGEILPTSEDGPSDAGTQLDECRRRSQQIDSRKLRSTRANRPLRLYEDQASEVADEASRASWIARIATVFVGSS
jgi:hypothetical protein